MDIRNNGHFYRARGKAVLAPSLENDLTSALEQTQPSNASSKILLKAYKDLMQQFNQLDAEAKQEQQLEIGLLSRQLSHLLKQAAKNTSYSGYPALSLLREIKQLRATITASSKDFA